MAGELTQSGQCGQDLEPLVFFRTIDDVSEIGHGPHAGIFVDATFRFGKLGSQLDLGSRGQFGQNFTFGSTQNEGANHA